MNINSFLTDLKINLLWDDEFITQVLEVNSERMSDISRMEQLPFSGLCNLSQMLGVSLDRLIQGQVDFDLVRKKFINPSQSIADEYTLGAGSYISSLRSMYNYTEKRLNTQAAIEMLKSNQVDKNVLLRNDLMVNVNLINNVFEYMVNELGFNQQDFKNMAVKKYVECERNSIIKLGSLAKSDGDILRIIGSSANVYEKNFTYKFIEIKPKEKYLLQSISNEVIHDLLHLKYLSSETVIDYKLAALKTTPILLGRNPLKCIKKESFIQNGRQVVNYFLIENNLSNSLQ